jgi:hypothetical protein
MSVHFRPGGQPPSEYSLMRNACLLPFATLPLYRTPQHVRPTRFFRLTRPWGKYREFRNEREPDGRRRRKSLPTPLQIMTTMNTPIVCPDLPPASPTPTKMRIVGRPKVRCWCGLMPSQGYLGSEKGEQPLDQHGSGETVILWYTADRGILGRSTDFRKPVGLSEGQVEGPEGPIPR